MNPTFRKVLLDMVEFMYPDLFEKLLAFGIRKIPTEKIILKPYLLKDWRLRSDKSSVRDDLFYTSSNFPR